MFYYAWSAYVVFRLPITKILDKIPTAHANLSASHDAWLTTAHAICTTDTFPKLLSRTFTLPSCPGHTYTLAGMTKGAGMIHPNMATLLGVICTDAPIEPTALQLLLKHAVDRSFNSISVDGDTSTNDTVAILANGAAGGTPITHDNPSISNSTESYNAMQDILTSFSQSLSQLVVRDGEGATKFITVRVKNSPDYASARLIASTIARSPLVKTALYGCDANWGRILCAIGYTQGVKDGTVIPERTSVSFKARPSSSVSQCRTPNIAANSTYGNNGNNAEGAGRVGDSSDSSAELPLLKLLVDGEPEVVDEERASALLQNEDLEIIVDLGGGDMGENGLGKCEDAVYWFCDFSHEYITINGDYRT